MFYGTVSVWDDRNGDTCASMATVNSAQPWVGAARSPLGSVTDAIRGAVTDAGFALLGEPVELTTLSVVGTLVTTYSIQVG